MGDFILRSIESSWSVTGHLHFEQIGSTPQMLQGPSTPYKTVPEEILTHKIGVILKRGQAFSPILVSFKMPDT